MHWKNSDAQKWHKGNICCHNGENENIYTHTLCLSLSHTHTQTYTTHDSKTNQTLWWQEIVKRLLHRTVKRLRHQFLSVSTFFYNVLLYRWRFIWLALPCLSWLALVCLGLLCICLCAFFMLLRFFPRVIMIMSSLWQCHCHFIKLMSLHFHWVCRPFIACLFSISSFAQSQHSFKHIWFIRPWLFFASFAIICSVRIWNVCGRDKQYIRFHKQIRN